MALVLTTLSMFFAVVPILGFLVLMWWLDRYDREPFWLVGLTFAWGAVGGITTALIGSAIAMLPLNWLLEPDVADAVGTMVVAPLIEEPGKAVVLFALWFSRHFDNTTDGFVYGAATGLGFGMTENFMYFVGVSMTGDVAVWGITVVVRTLYSALMHAAASSVVGAALGFAKFRPWSVRLVAIPAAFGAAMAIHGLWNGLLTIDGLAGTGGALTAVNFLVFPVEFFLLFVILQLCLLDERSTIRRELDDEAAAGRLPAEHVPILASYLRRSGRAWLPRGVDHHAYVRAATTLAFRKHQARRARRAVFYEQDVARLRAQIAALLRVTEL
ncbi:MAG: PrsW family intramembrane metalloprotease [Alphaproteobacteria bacterium]|nr:PrsW family intramembrane metalloprotease [Alphaproteobacteria bacterium]